MTDDSPAHDGDGAPSLVAIARPEAPAPQAATRCRACGYDLRGFDASAKCPECGTPVTRTLAGDLLAAADPGWLRVLTLGLWLDVAGASLTFVLSFPSIEYVLYGPIVEGENFSVRAWIVYLVAVGLTWAGTWNLTSPEPGVWSRSGEPLRLGLRWGAAAHVPLEIFGPQVSQPGLLGSELTVVATGALGLALAVMWWALLRHILLRIPRPGLALAAQFAMVGMVVTGFVVDLLPWLTYWLGMYQATAALETSPAGRLGQQVFTAAAIAVAALAAWQIGRLARGAHVTGQNPVGGSISHDEGSSVRG